MSTIQELRELSHKEIDAYWDIVESAKKSYTATSKGSEFVKSTPIEKMSPELLKMALDAGYVKADFGEVAERVASAKDAIKLTLQAGNITSGIRNSRPEEDKDTFLNNLEENTQEAAFALIRGKLGDYVEGTQYKLNTYDPSTGKMQVSVLNPNTGFFEGIGTTRGGYNTVGSLAWKMKDIMKGNKKPKAIIEAS